MKNLAIFSYSLFLVLVATSASAARLSVLFGSGSGGSSGGYVRIFVTSTTYDGNLGGIAGADAKCQARATAASLTGTWKAIISDSTTSAKSRMTHRLKPVFNLAGELVWNPSIPLMVSNDSVTSTGTPPWGAAAFIGNAPEITELGTLVSGTVYAWTGTSPTTGGAHGTNHCSNWTTTAATGAFGSSTSITTAWALASTGTCTQSYRLYCLEDE